MAKTKQVSDYVDVVQEKFPFLTKQEINKILTYGMKMYAFANNQHADVLFIDSSKDHHHVAHTGELGYDSYKHYFRWLTKWRMKERVLYRLLNKEWDGYYYIGLNDEQHEKIKRQRKTKVFKNVYLTKILKELYHNKLITHIWKVPYPADCGFKFFVNKLTSSEAEYIGENQYGKYHKCFYGRADDGCASVNDE